MVFEGQSDYQELTTKYLLRRPHVWDTNSQHKAKYALVLELWLQGCTYREIGDRLGFSRQRAQQLMRPPLAMQRLILKETGGHCENCFAVANHGHFHHKLRLKPAHCRENIQYLCTSCHKSADRDRHKYVPKGAQ